MNPDDIPLRELHLPDATGWWPLAPGWWFLIVLAVAGVVYLVIRVWRPWRANAPRRFAIRQLNDIRHNFEFGVDAVELCKQRSELLRRAMLAYAPRDEVAGLTGEDWLTWLDDGLENKPFSEGSGRLLESLPYMNPDKVDDDTDIAGLLDAIQSRLRQPLSQVVS